MDSASGRAGLDTGGKANMTGGCCIYKNTCIYRHTSPSGKVYIGVTKNRPEGRWQNGRGYKNNEYFYRAILKYGWNNFQHEIILDNLSYNDAAFGEAYLIEMHDATNRECGYNRANIANKLRESSGSTRRSENARKGNKPI